MMCRHRLLCAVVLVLSTSNIDGFQQPTWNFIPRTGEGSIRHQNALRMTFDDGKNPLERFSGLLVDDGNNPLERFSGILGGDKSAESKGSGRVPGLQPKPPSSRPPKPVKLINDEEALFAKAKEVLDSDLGLADESLLADDATFLYISGAPNTLGQVLNKQDYLAASQFFNLRETFPDLDYRAHDFRIVDSSEDDGRGLTVRLTARVVGTMRGPLRLRKEMLEATGRRMICPPETITMTFEPTTGKVTKLCTGFSMDRLVGNTVGLCGVLGAAVIAGDPPSEWEIYPPSLVVKRFFGRKYEQLQEPRNFLSPFPETVMISLAKSVIAAEYGVKDPDLLSNDFTYCSPNVGPLRKNKFLRVYEGFNMKGAFPDLDEKYTNFRVDPYDPYRVWADLIMTGTRTGEFAFDMAPSNQFVKTAPEAVSFTFDDDGYCIRLTNGAIMDPSVGNSGSLGGVYGLLYGSGNPLVDTSARPWPQTQLRLQKALSSPLTGVGVDDYKLPGKSVLSKLPSTTESSIPVKLKPPPQMPKLDNRFEAPKVQVPPLAPRPSISPPKNEPPKTIPPKISLPKVKVPLGKGQSLKVSSSTKSSPPKAKLSPPKISKDPAKTTISDSPGDPVTEAFSTFFGTASPATSPATSKTPKKAPSAAPQSNVELAKKRKQEIEAKNAALKRENEKKLQDLRNEREAAKKAAFRKKENAKRAAEEKKAELERLKEIKLEQIRKKEEAKRAAEEKKAELQKLKEAKVEQQKKTNAAKAKQVVEDAPPGATISLASLFGSAFGFDPTEDNTGTAGDKSRPSKKPSSSMKAAKKVDVGTIAKPPRGVPVLVKWRKNFNGSITGKVSASKDFDNGELITTSRIASGTIKPGNVVETASGSKYFLT